MKIAYDMPGGVHVMTPVLDGKTLEEWLAEHGHAIPAEAQNVTLVTETPDDRSDRHMWAIEDGKIVVRRDDADAWLRYGKKWSPEEVATMQARETAPMAINKIEPPRSMGQMLDDLSRQPVSERQPWSLKDLMRRAEQPEPPELPAAHDEPPAAPELPPIPLPAPVADELPSVEAQPVSEPVETSPEPASLPPLPEPQPLPPIALPDPPELEAHRAPVEAVVTDAERKRQAIERVTFAAAQLDGNQIRYEVAIQATNGNVSAQEMLQEEASIYRTDVLSLAHRIIAQRTLLEQRVMRAYAAKARALMNIDMLAGSDIDAAAEAAVRQIKEEGHAGAA